MSRSDDLTCAAIGLGGRGVIKTWTEFEVAARVRLYMLTSNLTSLVPPQVSHWLQVRKVGTVYLFFYFYFNFYYSALLSNIQNEYKYLTVDL